MLEVSTHLPNERHSEPRPIHTVLKPAFHRSQKLTSHTRFNLIESGIAQHKSDKGYEMSGER